MSAPQISAKVVAISTTLSPYPASFNGNPWLYGMSLASLLAISMFMAVALWDKSRMIWVDRYLYHPTQPIFLYRLMMVIICLMVFIRCVPEVAYMTFYGEVTGDTMAAIMTVRQMANIVALPAAIGWLAIYVVIDPFVTLALKANMHLGRQRADFLSNWHRFARPFVIFVTILVIASLMAAAKGSLGHGG